MNIYGFKISKKVLSVLLCVALLFSFAPISSLTAFAMQVFIEVTVDDGKQHITLEVEPTDRIEDVKAKIAEQNGTPVADQVLTFAGKVLEDGNTLQDYSIQKDSTIRLLVRNKVYFDTNGGESVDPITVIPGEKYGTLPSSAITGLSGGNKNWYLVDENGNVTDINIKKLTTVEVERDHTLFIKRTVLAPTVSIALTVPGGISNGYQYYIPGASQRILTATVGNMNTEILDYTYQWYKDGVLIEGATSSVLTLDGNVSDSGAYKVEVTATLKDSAGIVVTANSATGSKEQKVKILHAANTLSYDANGGEGGPQSSYTGGDTLTVSGDAPTREHYDFIGWNTLSDGTGDAYKAADVYTFAEDNGNGGCVVTLYAQWSGKECTITFMSEDGVYKTLTYKYGETVEMPEAPAKDGYTVEWDTVIDTVTGDMTVNAVYTKIPITDTNPPQTEDNNSKEDNTKTEDDTNAENNTQTGNNTQVDNTQADNIQADNADKSTNSPKTADYSNLWLWVALVVVSGAIALTVCNKKRKISKN